MHSKAPAISPTLYPVPSSAIRKGSAPLLRSPAMAPSLTKIMSLAVALLLLATTPQARGWAAEDDDDMVPVQSPAERVLVAIPGGGGVGTRATSSVVCLQCQCCSKASPGKCEMTNCCSSINCDPAGKCNLVPTKCGCNGCGGAS